VARNRTPRVQHQVSRRACASLTVTSSGRVRQNRWAATWLAFSTTPLRLPLRATYRCEDLGFRKPRAASSPKRYRYAGNSVEPVGRALLRKQNHGSPRGGRLDLFPVESEELHPGHHDAGGRPGGVDVPGHGLVPNAAQHRVEAVTLEPAELRDRVDPLLLEGRAHQTVHGAPVAVAQVVGDLLLGLAFCYEPDGGCVTRGGQGMVLMATRDPGKFHCNGVHRNCAQEIHSLSHGLGFPSWRSGRRVRIRYSA